MLRLEKIGNGFVLTDVESDEVRQDVPAEDVYYRIRDERIIFFELNYRDREVASLAIADCVDENNTPFDEAGIRDWCRINLASVGDPGAIEVVINQTGIGVFTVS